MRLLENEGRSARATSIIRLPALHTPSSAIFDRIESHPFTPHTTHRGAATPDCEH